MQLLHKWQDHFLSKGHRSGQAHAAAHLARRCSDVVGRSLQLLEKITHPLEVHNTCVGRRNLARRPVQQPDVELGLHGRHGPRHLGGCQAETPGRAGKASLSHDFDEGP